MTPGPPVPDPGPVEPVRADHVALRLAAVRARIASAGGRPDRVRICAVTKGLGIDAVRAALDLGLVDLGENYAQELLAKDRDLTDVEPGPSVRWHMIGRLQRNKVRLLAGRVAWWQSVDRIELGEEIARHDPEATVLVQVNATSEPGKGGMLPGEVAAAVDRFRHLGLDVRGLMAVGPTEASVDPRPGFELTAALGRDLGLAELSMGMSDDLEAGVAAGSTMVRVGTALFGPRPPRGVTSGGRSGG